MKRRSKSRTVTLIFALIIMIVLIIGFINLFNTMDARDEAEAIRQTKHIEKLEKEAASYKRYDLSDAEFIETVQVTTAEPAPVITPEEFEVLGVIDWNGWKYTYYSEYVLPGEGLKIPGRHSDGKFVRDENDFLCVASNEHPYGSKVETPFGTAIVYDMVGDDVTGIIDLYVSFN